jgi:glycosyltransferase involved in cell wall biosynthesis
MKLAYITEHPTDDVTAFSGIPHFMSMALRQTFEAVQIIQAPPYSYELAQTDVEAGREQLRRIGSAASDRLRGVDYDAVLCQGSSMIPFLRTDRPIFLWHDSVFSALAQIPFEEFRSKFPLLYEWDRLTLEKLTLAGFAADWQIEHVKRHYGVPAEKLIVLPFGANVEPESSDAVFADIRSRDKSCCKLSFLGIDWARKGLHLAYDVMRELNRRGVPATLDIIGCALPRLPAAKRLKRSLRLWFQDSPTERLTITLPHDARVQQSGFLRKDNPGDVDKMKTILRRSHFLLHPASFECFGIALAEANAFGVPVITTAAHGPDTIIRSGVNGYKYDAGQFVENAVRQIAAIWRDGDQYIQYSTRLNWLTSAELLKAQMAKLVGGRACAS